MMSCPCNLFRNEVFELDRRDLVKLIGGRCQNLLANGEEGVCGQAIGSHIPAGKTTFSIFITFFKFLLPDHSQFFLCLFLVKVTGRDKFLPLKAGLVSVCNQVKEQTNWLSTLKN